MRRRARSASTWSRRTSRRDRSGNRCISSRHSGAAACAVDPSPRNCSRQASACRAGPACRRGTRRRSSRRSWRSRGSWGAGGPEEGRREAPRVPERSSRTSTVRIWSNRFGAGALQVGLVVLSNWLAFLLRFDWSLPPYAREAFWQTLPWLVAIRALAFIPFRLNDGLWRYASIYDVRAIVGAVTASSLTFLL